MVSLKSLVSLSSYSPAAALLMLVVAVAVLQSQTVESQSCPTELASLNVCTPFVVPGGAVTAPSIDCCNALQSVHHDFLYSTLQIASRLTSQCNIPPLTCA
ncbi:Stamen-specific protein FIL1 [Hibiscus syriacus]|uniref:Stamen-specific protein FIL1 n=1 Tax=Hibiscus syriacus TaxID=106335 RepID=A0A6A2Y032_HIBSY|nr:protein 108-like [Hibiscus syriacus]KAE8662647.1 Stamen-specific protein FIL1 [Hibiscus syriacus]